MRTTYSQIKIVADLRIINHWSWIMMNRYISYMMSLNWIQYSFMHVSYVILQWIMTHNLRAQGILWKISWEMIKSRFHTQENTAIHHNIDIDNRVCKNNRMDRPTSNCPGVTKFWVRVIKFALNSRFENSRFQHEWLRTHPSKIFRLLPKDYVRWSRKLSDIAAISLVKWH